MTNPPPPDSAALTAMIARASRAGKGPPPVERWEPPFCGDIDMEIRRDGSWFYMGTPIGRQAMVDLFASVLRKDGDGKTYLVTPVEKLGIRVEDAHFSIVEITVAGAGETQVIVARTNTGDVVEAGPEHPLWFETEAATGGLKPYIRVRGRLDGLLTRAAMLNLVEAGEESLIDGRLMFAVRSRGVWFPIMPADAAGGQA
jgi:hypothetical protein